MTWQAVPGPPVELSYGHAGAAGLPQHGGIAVRDLATMRSRLPGRSTRTASRSACARPSASRMLLIARLLTTTSNDAEANARSRASASASST